MVVSTCIIAAVSELDLPGGSHTSRVKTKG